MHFECINPYIYLPPANGGRSGSETHFRVRCYRNSTMGALNDALGITPSQSGSAARGAGHGPWTPATPATPQKSWGDWLHDQMATPTHQQSKGGGAHPAAYLESAGGGRTLRIENVMLLDGKVVHRSVMEREERRQSRDPSGVTGFDPRQTMTPPGQINA